jgi:hypothetical protein
MENELMLTIIQELQSSAIDGTSSGPWNSQASGLQRQPIMPGFVYQDVSTEPSVRINYDPACIQSAYPPVPVANGTASHFGCSFDVARFYKTSMLQNGQPIVGKNTVIKNNDGVQESDTYHLTLHECVSTVDGLNEDSFKDFVMLPLGEIESILSSNDNSSYSVTPDSLPSLSNDLPILEAVFMDSQSTSNSQNYEQKLEARHSPNNSALFQTELSLFKSQANSGQDVATASDNTCAFNCSNGNALDSQMHLHGNIEKGNYLEKVAGNAKFHNQQSQTSCNNSEPVSNGVANSMVNFNPGTGSLCNNLSMQSAAAWMERR